MTIQHLKLKEFWDDIKRFKYLKRLFRKYETTGSIKIRLVVNHIVVLQNVFGIDVVLHCCYIKMTQNTKQY